jgi:ribonuclease Z
MTFEVTILGSSSATPIYQRHPTAQVLNIHERFFLIDCGEGTLIQMNRFRIKFHRINHVFISHLHGDHYLGLMGLLSTMHLQGRAIPLHLYAPPELKEIIDIQLRYSQTELRYELKFHAIHASLSKVIFEDEDLEVSTIVLNHRIACTGFLFKEKQKLRKLIKDKILQFNIPVTVFPELKNGADFVMENGQVIPNEAITSDPRSPRSYAFCSDTLYHEKIIQQVSGIDLLYHEATFMNDKADRAIQTFHTTAAQAAAIAKNANVKRLIIGHFSARYKNLYPLLEEAKEVFENTTLALEGDRFTID